MLMQWINGDGRIKMGDDVPFTVCSECGSPVLTEPQKMISLCLFFESAEGRDDFKQMMVDALPGLKAYEY